MVIFLCTSCDKQPPHSTAHTRSASEPTLAQLRAELARARIDLAKQAVARHAPEEALPLLVAAMEASPTPGEALTMAGELLQRTRWHFPEVSLHHGPASIEALHIDSTSTLWAAVSLDGGDTPNTSIHTVARWNLESLRIENVLFPTQANDTRCLLFDPAHRFAVIQRSRTGSENTVLLCDAQSLHPICDLGPLPKFLSPSAVIAFSADGLLIAHPTFSANSHGALVWNIRDTETGEMIRTSEANPPDHPMPLTASLNRSRLRVLRSDGTLLEIPVSSVNPETKRSILSPVHLTQAQFRENDAFAEALHEYDGPHRRPTLITMTIDETQPLDPSASVASLERFPWTTQPNIWNGLLREEKFPRIRVDQTRVTFPSLPFPSYDVNSSITAVALRGDRIAFGDINGGLHIFQLLPLPSPQSRPGPRSWDTPGPNGIAAFADLVESVTGNRYDTTNHRMVRSNNEQRLLAIDRCDFQALNTVFPDFDFTPLRDAIRKSPPRTQSPDAAGLFHTRLTRYLEKPTFPDIENAFANADVEKIHTAIQSAAPSGAQAATCLALALSTTQPAWIHLCRNSFPQLPPLLTRIAHSRIAWLENRKADAIAAWPDPFPDYDHIRRSEDWDGWEAADFRIAFELIRQSISSELAKLTVPEKASREQRDTIHAHLTDESTLHTLGRARYARACLDAATRFASFPDETERTFELAQIARAMGAPPAPCLRAEALALTALLDHTRARERWVELLSLHPVSDHLSSDYAEAAYSAFENNDPTQAMAILATGMHRFPKDSAFALRAGWIALLTNHPDAAYRFLLAGHHTKWQPDQTTHAHSLLAIAAFQSGAPEESAAWFQELIRLDPSWRDEKFITALTWPDELKSVLHHLAQHAMVTPDR